MPLLLLAWIMLGLAVTLFGRRLGRRCLLVAAAPHLIGAVALAAGLDRAVGPQPPSWRVRWVPDLHLGIELQLDRVAWTMGALILVVGLLVSLYGYAYFTHGTEVHRTAGLLMVFAASMFGLVLAADLLTMFVFWELTSITSYLLIGNDDRSSAARGAASQALLTTGLGGLALLAGVVCIGVATGTTRFDELATRPLGGAVVAAGAALLLVAAFTKSAQFPFSFWLPGAMVAPTPVSAYLHSATMVKAGLVLVARMAPELALAVGWWRPIVAVVALITMLTGAVQALRQNDLKVLLAHGTVSQLGFMFLLLGWGTTATTVAGWTLVLSHGLFKSALFLVVGTVDHGYGHRDLRRLQPGIGDWRVVRVVGTIAAASMAGVPPLLGFVAKDAAFDAMGDESLVVLMAMVLGSVLTAAYAARLVWGLWGGGAGADARPPAHPAGVGLVGPAVVPVAALVTLGLVPAVLDRVVDGHLALWHGLVLPLYLSLGALAGGAVVFALLGRSVGEPRTWGPTGAAGFSWVVTSINRFAARTIGVLQNGSLPIYLLVIVATAVAVPTVMAVTGGGLRMAPAGLGRGLDLVAAAVLIGGAIAVTVVRRRFAAALALGAVGSGMTLVFLLAGAPDLALTQLAVETLSTLVFVMVFTVLPDRFERAPVPTPRGLQIGRVLVAAAFGVFTMLAVSAAVGAGRSGSVSEEFVARSYAEAGGRNIVNVILVDFRGFDTLGEITVLAVCALGGAVLVRDVRRRREERT